MQSVQALSSLQVTSSNQPENLKSLQNHQQTQKVFSFASLAALPIATTQQFNTDNKTMFFNENQTIQRRSTIDNDQTIMREDPAIMCFADFQSPFVKATKSPTAFEKTKNLQAQKTASSLPWAPIQMPVKLLKSTDQDMHASEISELRQKSEFKPKHTQFDKTHIMIATSSERRPSFSTATSNDQEQSVKDYSTERTSQQEDELCYRSSSISTRSDTTDQNNNNMTSQQQVQQQTLLATSTSSSFSLIKSGDNYHNHHHNHHHDSVVVSHFQSNDNQINSARENQTKIAVMLPSEKQHTYPYNNNNNNDVDVASDSKENIRNNSNNNTFAATTASNYQINSNYNKKSCEENFDSSIFPSSCKSQSRTLLFNQQQQHQQSVPYDYPSKTYSMRMKGGARGAQVLYSQQIQGTCAYGDSTYQQRRGYNKRLPQNSFNSDFAQNTFQPAKQTLQQRPAFNVTCNQALKQLDKRPKQPFERSAHPNRLQYGLSKYMQCRAEDIFHQNIDNFHEQETFITGYPLCAQTLKESLPLPMLEIDENDNMRQQNLEKIAQNPEQQTTQNEKKKNFWKSLVRDANGKLKMMPLVSVDQ